MPVYLSDVDDEKKPKKRLPKPTKDDVFLPYWLDVERQRKVKLYQEGSNITGAWIVKRSLWLCFCFGAAVAIGGRSCGI